MKISDPRYEVMASSRRICFFVLCDLVYFLFYFLGRDFSFYLALLQVWKFLLGYYQWHQPAEVAHIELYNTDLKGCKILNLKSLYI